MALLAFRVLPVFGAIAIWLGASKFGDGLCISTSSVESKSKNTFSCSGYHKIQWIATFKARQSILKICDFLRLVLRGILGEEMRSASALVVPPFRRERNGPLRRRQTSAKELSGIWIFNFSWSTLLL